MAARHSAYLRRASSGRPLIAMSGVKLVRPVSTTSWRPAAPHPPSARRSLMIATRRIPAPRHAHSSQLTIECLSQLNLREHNDLPRSDGRVTIVTVATAELRHPRTASIRPRAGGAARRTQTRRMSTMPIMTPGVYVPTTPDPTGSPSATDMLDRADGTEGGTAAAVKSYFENGGQKVYVSRAAETADAWPAPWTAADADTDIIG